MPGRRRTDPVDLGMGCILMAFAFALAALGAPLIAVAWVILQGGEL